MGLYPRLRKDVVVWNEMGMEIGVVVLMLTNGLVVLNALEESGWGWLVGVSLPGYCICFLPVGKRKVRESGGHGESVAESPV